MKGHRERGCNGCNVPGPRGPKDAWKFPVIPEN